MLTRLKRLCSGLAPWQTTTVLLTSFATITLALLLLWAFKAYNARCD